MPTNGTPYKVAIHWGNFHDNTSLMERYITVVKVTDAASPLTWAGFLGGTDIEIYKQ